MLETPEERVRLLKAGLTGKIIEELYIKYNHFNIVRIPTLFEIVEFSMSQSEIDNEMDIGGIGDSEIGKNDNISTLQKSTF